MIRHILCLIAVSFTITNNAMAQGEAARLTSPSSPAFSILNFEPAAVLRPTTNKDLSSDVLNSFDKEGKLLVNLGLEITPYWLQSRPTLTRNRYLNPDPVQAFKQSFSLSAATVKDSTSGDNRLGAGFRFKVFDGTPVEDLVKPQAELKAENTIIATIANVRSMVGDEVKTKQEAIDVIVQALITDSTDDEIITAFREDAASWEKNYGESQSDITLFLEKLISNRNDANNQLVKKVAELLYQRKGFMLEFAGATGFNTTKNSKPERMGGWVNASYYVSPNDLFTLTGRYMYQNSKNILSDTSFNNLDVGLGFLKKTSTYNISIESVFRWYKGEIPAGNVGGSPTERIKNFTYRVAVQSSYIITTDFSLNFSLGKNFNSPFDSGPGFFSILGFNYSIFNKERVDLTKE